MNNKTRITVLVLLGVALVAAVVILRARASRTKANEPSEVPGAVSVARVAHTQAAAAGRKLKGGAGGSGVSNDKLQSAKKVPRGVTPVGEDDDPDVATQAEAERVIAPFQERLDSDDLAVVAAAARQIMGHANKFVRIKAVEALAWSEEAGYKDLKSMIYDQDPEVSREALDAWALQTQTMDNSKAKQDAVREVGEAALNMEAEAFGKVLDAMIDMDAAWVLPVLQSYANQTDNQETLDQIYDAVALRAMPDEEIKSKADIPPAIDQFMRKRAEEAAAEAAEELK